MVRKRRALEERPDRESGSRFSRSGCFQLTPMPLKAYHRTMTTILRRLRPLFPPASLRPITAVLVLLGSASLLAAAAEVGRPAPARPALKMLPVRGLHLMAPARKDLPTALDFIRETLPAEGVNTLILEFDYNYDFRSRPDFGNPSALGRVEVQQIVKLCREKKIELIPQLNCLGHQSWGEHTAPLLAKHPEFDETPGKYPKNKDIYCRSYCPLHPEVHLVLFTLIDELAAACEAKSFHVGMDEVFILADADCPRCKGKTSAEAFAAEVNTLHDHLKKIGCRMWMWSDRFIDGKAAGVGKWEGSENGTFTALEHVPKDIVMCDWHYDKAPETASFFALRGFDVVECPWRKTDVALAELEQLRAVQANPKSAVAHHARGMLQTTWCGFNPFVAACRAQQSGSVSTAKDASESADCFFTLFKALREKP